MIPGMMSDKGSKLAALIMKDQPKTEVKESPEVSEDNIGLEAAAEDLIAAIKADDAKALAKALESAVSLCSHSTDEEKKEETKEG